MTGPAASPPPLTRAVNGRWLGGVCAGIAQARGVPANAVRLAFAAAALLGGLGVLAYLAWWLIVPAEGEEDAGPPRSHPIVAFVLGGAGAIGLATLAAAAAAATIFGLGGVVVAVAAVTLAGGLASWRRLGPAWALLPVAALALPSVALSAGGVRIARQSGDQERAPRTLAEVPRGGYRVGLGELLVDLRHTALPRSGDHTIRIEGGVRQTLVALPHDRCLTVIVSYHLKAFPLRAALLLSGRPTPSGTNAVTLFDRTGYGGRGDFVSTRTRRPSPLVLRIDYTSAGGGLIVRDWPDGRDPSADPDWPGYGGWVTAEPDTTGLSRAAARKRQASWRRRQLRMERALETRRQGPCAAKGERA